MASFTLRQLSSGEAGRYGARGEDEALKQRVASQAVRAVQAAARRLSRCKQPRPAALAGHAAPALVVVCTLRSATGKGHAASGARPSQPIAALQHPVSRRGNAAAAAMRPAKLACAQRR